MIVESSIIEPMRAPTGETFVEHLKSTAPSERQNLIDELLTPSNEDDLTWRVNPL